MISKNQIKYIQALHLKKNRDEQGLFIIEGVKLVSEFLIDPIFKIKEIFALKDFLTRNENILNDKNIPQSEITFEELAKISLQQAPNQVLAVVLKKKFSFTPTLLRDDLTLYIDDIRDPGNLGTIIRIADWFGIKQVACSPTTTDIYNPKALQASMGAILRTNVFYMDFEELMVGNNETPIYGAVLNGQNIYTTPLKNGIIVIGNEANGISEHILSYVNTPITIPAASQNGSESLNAANACAIICAEFHRQHNFLK